MSRFLRDRLCSSKHLKSLHTFALADFEQQFIPAIAKASAVNSDTETEDIN